ncbi:MAG: hypothetical protein EHM12_11310 [Dehalococcoidia bacterium]|nr:MAG: hypothetical protein EHM12_11310 [Dehalococcoidia bacterium]
MQGIQGYVPSVTNGTLTSMRTWRPQVGKQELILQRSEREVCAGGARGGIKSESGLALGIDPEVIYNPRFQGLVIRKNYQDLADWIQRARIFYDGFATIMGNPSEIHWKGKNGQAGGITRLSHWKDTSDISSHIGKEYQRLNIEELTDCVKSLEEYKMLLGSCRSTIEGVKPKIYLSTNPGGPGHGWVKEYFVNKATMKPYYDDGLKSWRIFIPTTIEDNPILIERDPEYYNYLRSLPEPLYSMWYKGSWDVAPGMFFYDFDTHLSIEPHRILGDLAANRLFGALDIGVGHPTAFGLFYLTPEGRIELLFSYVKKQQDHRSHAQAIFQKIESFGDWIDGCFPLKIFCGHDFDRTFKASQEVQICARDEYEDVFRSRDTQFVLANIERVYGCQCLRTVLSCAKGVPAFLYWKLFNSEFETALKNIPVDKTNIECYDKVTGDDAADMFRYGVAGVMSEINTEKQRRETSKRTGVIPFDMSGLNNYEFKETGLV